MRESTLLQKKKEVICVEYEKWKQESIMFFALSLPQRARGPISHQGLM